MNENLDLTKILKDCPKGTKLYSPIFGNVTLDDIIENCDDYPIMVNTDTDDGYDSFTKDGKLYDTYDGECMLFPSKDNRDWSTFKVPSKLPKTWEEFCENNPVTKNEYYISENSCFHKPFPDIRACVDKNLLPNKEIAEAMLALCQLIQLRDCYNKGWKPDYTNNHNKYVINVDKNEISRTIVVTIQNVLTFKTRELRDTFLNNFKDLIEIAKPLL